MKSLALILLAIVGSAFAEEPGPGEPVRMKQSEKASEKPQDPSAYNFHFELQIVDAPTTDALPLIESMRDPSQMEKSVAKLHAMIGQRKAKLVSLLTLAAKSGERAVAEDIDEIRYGVEFEPPRLAEKRNGQIESLLDADPGKPPVPKPERAEPKPGDLESLAAMATTFETRNVGSILEIESILNGETRRIDAQLRVDHVFFAGMEKLPVIADGKKSIVEQPRFESNRTSTSLNLSNNQRVLLGTYKASGTEGHMELFLFRASVRPVE